MQSEIRDNTFQSRFELPVGDSIAFVEYRREGDHITLTHTEVPEALSGQGVGSKLVRGVLDALAADGRRIVARCDFAAGYVERHPQYRNLLAGDA
jgi:predicted GNAT family acetyltransferase